MNDYILYVDPAGRLHAHWPDVDHYIVEGANFVEKINELVLTGKDA
jgi:hypothetical protein